MIVAEDWRASLKTEGSRGAQTGSSPEGGSSAGCLLKAGRTGKDAKTAVCEPTGEGGGGSGCKDWGRGCSSKSYK